MYRNKRDILLDWPELELSEFGDFVIKPEYVKGYEIIDFHCHLFAGLKEYFPNYLKKEKMDMEASFFSESYSPFSLKLFDGNKTTFTNYPETIFSIDGIKAKFKFLSGGFVIRKSTPKRMIRDMKLNNINQGVVLQINPPNKNSAIDMDLIMKENKELMTFACIHPGDDNITEKVQEYLNMNIKGWKISPHVGNFRIDDDQSIALLKVLADTKLPIISCSGLGVPVEFINSGVISKKQKQELSTQRILSFYKVLRLLPNIPFIFAHGGLFEIDSLIKLMKVYPNTYTDISSQPWENIKRLIKEIGNERLLFGTDYPFWNHAFSIASVLRATDSHNERQNIFSFNAKKILNIV